MVGGLTALNKILGPEYRENPQYLHVFVRHLRVKSLIDNRSVIADDLRMFGSGMKVCVEIVATASDANLLPVEDVISVAGTRYGADTSVVIAANSTNQFFNIKVREILAKPRYF